ncbi:MAG: lycopene cyclase domain-containing protein [Actinomycetota bacterium]|nr:lycopene cyclase domain-containing protein [Actinomycetota bacterium]
MRWHYLLVLVACLCVALPLERLCGTRVLARPRRLAGTLAPVFGVFAVWDVLAVRAGQWSFDPRQVLGARIGGLPVEELLFFVVVPLCSVLSLEAVRRVTGWRAGDEP